MRRIFWLAMGLGAGVASAVLASRWARRQAEKLSPPNLARRFGRSVQDMGAVVAEAGREFSRAMTERESELRASLDR